MADKDAVDVFRLMRATDPSAVGATLAALCGHPVAGPASRDGLVRLEALFGRRGAQGIELAARALRVAVPRDRVATICLAYTARLAAAVDPVDGRRRK